MIRKAKKKTPSDWLTFLLHIGKDLAVLGLMIPLVRLFPIYLRPALSINSFILFLSLVNKKDRQQVKRKKRLQHFKLMAFLNVYLFVIYSLLGFKGSQYSRNFLPALWLSDAYQLKEKWLGTGLHLLITLVWLGTYFYIKKRGKK